ELVVAGDVDHRRGVELRLDDEPQCVLDALADVAGDHHSVVLRARLRKHQVMAPVHVQVQIGEGPELHGEGGVRHSGPDTAAPISVRAMVSDPEGLTPSHNSPLLLRCSTHWARMSFSSLSVRSRSARL